MPPRAVSSTATSTSERPSTAAAPPGPVQSPGSSIRPSTTIPSEVVAPTRRPAPPSTWATIRVTVVFPFVPEIEMTGTRRSASRTIVGPWSRGPEMRPSAAMTSWWSYGVARGSSTSVAASCQAASASVRARSAPRQGNDTIQRPRSAPRWTWTSSAGPLPASSRSRPHQVARRDTAAGRRLGGIVAQSRVATPSTASRSPCQGCRRPRRPPP